MTIRQDSVRPSLFGGMVEALSVESFVDMLEKVDPYYPVIGSTVGKESFLATDGILLVYGRDAIGVEDLIDTGY